MTAVAAARGRAVAAVSALWLLTACIGSGSEVGPEFPPLESSSLQGLVADPTGAPIADAVVTIQGDSVLTDKRGRFRFVNKPDFDTVVHVDARATTTLTDPPGEFDQLTVAGSFTGLQGIFRAPILLPNFTNGASATVSVNQGSALAGTLVDPASGAELVLDGAVASIPGSPLTSATLRFVSLPAGAVAAPLDVQGLQRAGALYFAIAPAGLQFTVPPTIRVVNTTFAIDAAILSGKNPAPEIDLLNPQTGVWDLTGPVANAGGFLTSTSIPSAGLYALSTALTPSQQTIVTSRILDRDLEALPKAVALARDGRSSIADDTGSLAIPDTCAADADGNPIPLTLTLIAPLFRAHHQFLQAVVQGVPGQGLVTDFGDRPLSTIPSGRARVMGVYRGQAVSGYKIGVANTYFGTFTAADFANPDSTTFFDVPLGNYLASADGLTVNGYGARGVRAFNMPSAGAVISGRIFIDRSNLTSQEQSGTVKIQAGRATSSTVLYKAFSMLGIDPGITLQGVASGAAVDLKPIVKGPALTTTIREYDVVGVGTPIDTFRRIAYVTMNSDAAVRRPQLAADHDLSPTGFDAGGSLAGTVMGLTDPGATTPALGNYAVEVRARRVEDFENRLAVALGGQTDLNTILPVKGTAPTFALPEYAAVTPGGTVATCAVERDTAMPGSFLGVITKVGFAPSTSVPTGSARALDLTLVPAAPVPVMTSVSGAVPLTFRTSLVAEIADGNGLDLGDQADATFNALTGELVVAVPSIGASKTAAVLTATGTTANGSAYFTSAASVLTPGELATFLTIPEVSAPPPPPGQRIQLDPTGTGLTWAADPNTQETVIRVSRVGVKTNTGGELVQTTQDWLLTLPGPLTFPVKFPVAPPNLGDHPVPGFFEAGAVYDLSIEARSFLEYDARTAATSPDILKAGYFKLRAVARTQTQFQIP